MPYLAGARCLIVAKPSGSVVMVPSPITEHHHLCAIGSAQWISINVIYNLLPRNTIATTGIFDCYFYSGYARFDYCSIRNTVDGCVVIEYLNTDLSCRDINGPTVTVTSLAPAATFVPPMVNCIREYGNIVSFIRVKIWAISVR